MEILEKLKAAPDGRAGRDGVPARQDEEHEIQRRVLLVDEALILRRIEEKAPRMRGFFVRTLCRSALERRQQAETGLALRYPHVFTSQIKHLP